ncbi:MAG: hypothetical protein PHS53_02195 [Candidatus Pacebacteria bacterium]|nr:hypothetical protein [Candidatus Paceibacterota bacterium]MDD5356936.1 hypothetical protein [Candidatus Paceibacterota bacterium]
MTEAIPGQNSGNPRSADRQEKINEMILARNGVLGLVKTPKQREIVREENQQFIIQLRKNNPGRDTLAKYQAWQIFSSGTDIQDEKAPELDFPGEDSLIEFYKRLEEKLKS